MKSAGQPGAPEPAEGGGLARDLHRNPRPLVVAAAAQGLQALALVCLGAYTCLTGITGGADDLLDAELVGGLALLGGAALFAVARALLGARGWARSPALVWQLIMIPVGLSTVDDVPVAGVALLTSVVVIVGGMFAPSAGEALEAGENPQA